MPLSSKGNERCARGVHAQQGRRSSEPDEEDVCSDLLEEQSQLTGEGAAACCEGGPEAAAGSSENHESPVTPIPTAPLSLFAFPTVLSSIIHGKRSLFLRFIVDKQQLKWACGGLL